MQTWHEAIGSEKSESYFQHIIETVKKERGMGRIIYPPAEDVFNAFKATEFGNVKVVILGQDPYHGAGQAHGLAFSVREGVAVPPSLANIYKELADDIEGFRIPQHGYLQYWAEQGVLLLNTVLTVRADRRIPMPHWVGNALPTKWSTKSTKTVNTSSSCFGAATRRKKGAFIDRSRHLVLSAPHPSPLSAYRGFFGCKHFSRANAYLQEKGITPIDWQV